MKKILALLLAGVIPVALVGCSNGGSSLASSKAESATEAKTEPATEPATEAITEITTEEVTEVVTEEPTEPQPDWSAMYYSYVTENAEPLIWGDTTSPIKADTPFALHDFDMDGIPELILGSWGARMGLSVYTVYDGMVVHSGDIGGRASFYSDNEKYHGIFRSDSFAKESVVVYSGLQDGKIVSEKVVDTTYDDSGNGNTTISNQTLYDVYMACTTQSDESAHYRKPKNELKTYDWSEVQSDGWDAFIGRYGY
ncbi:MAG: hypothetical protein IIZ23_09260 [Ruminococcus sp.]|nr:hypothetical protein [Ruminococcus sp.]